MQTGKTIELFYCSVAGDESFRRELDDHLHLLVLQKVLSTWHESQIVPGVEKQPAIDRHFDSAQVIVLLLSANFFNSDECYKLMNRALAAEKAGTKRVIPILIRAMNVAWTPLKDYAILPADGKPVNSSSNREPVWEQIALKIGEIAIELQGASSSQSVPDTTPPRPANPISTAEEGKPMTFRPPRSFSQNPTIPGYGQHFLTIEEREYIIQFLATFIRQNSRTTLENLLYGKEKLSAKEVARISFSENRAPLDIAEDVVNCLQTRGSAQVPTTHVLGAFVRDLLKQYSDTIPREEADKLVILVFHHTLLTDLEQVAELSARFQVPSPLLSRQELLDHPLSSTASSIQTNSGDLREQFESIYNKFSHIRDITFLEKGTKVARAVCRIDFDGQGEGTGFLVAPDLVLTNYHVMNPQDYEGELEERARRCEVRFGVIDGVDVGTTVGLNKSQWYLEKSEPEDLDFMLLQLERSVTENNISPIVPNAYTVQKDEFVYIIQYPEGKTMAVSLGLNKVTRVEKRRIHYLAGTKGGSSGSPVFDDSWRLVALHQSGGITDGAGNQIVAANIGIPIAPIRERIRQHL